MPPPQPASAAIQALQSPGGKKLIVQVLGFYDRGNLGDESYKHTFELMFAAAFPSRHRNDERYELRFACTDDIGDALPADTDVVICGGGDIINDYFMHKVMRLVAHTTLPCYALSIGLPYTSAARKYLAFFDHVFVRSTSDAKTARSVLGEGNVSMVPDLAFIMLRRTVWPVRTWYSGLNRPYSLVVCLAQPVFVHDTTDALSSAVADSIAALVRGSNTQITVTLASFNTHDPNAKENDNLINAKMSQLLADRGVQCAPTVSCTTVDRAREVLGAAQGVICMRYHSFIFSMLENKPVFVLYTTSKVRKLLQDAELAAASMYPIPVDPATDIPTGEFDTAQVAANMRATFFGSAQRQISSYLARGIAAFSAAVTAVNYNPGGIFDQKAVSEAYLRAVRNVIVQRRMREWPLGSLSEPMSTAGASEPVRDGNDLHDTCIQRVLDMIRCTCTTATDVVGSDITLADVRNWYQHSGGLGLSPSPSPYTNEDEEERASRAAILKVAQCVTALADDVARILCYTATAGSMNSSCAYGMADKLRRGEPASLPSDEPACVAPSVREQVNWVRGAFERKRLSASAATESQQQQQPDSLSPPQTITWLRERARVMIDVDHLSQSDFSGYHRCGWAYAVAGLRYLNPTVHGRTPPLVINFDTFIDRTFHWGSLMLKCLGILPYSKPWAGIVHHTFDTTHSGYNCERLLDAELFQASLASCVALFALTRDLRDKIAAGLAARGLRAVPIYVVPHPTEVITDPARRFTVDKFSGNENRCIVQIGAWLRNPYGIYDLRLGPGAPPKFKAVLRGRDMGMYFEPSPPRLPLIRPPGEHTMDEDQDGPFLCALEDQVDEMIASWRNTDGDGGICRPCGPCRPARDPCRPCEAEGDGDGNSGGPCRPARDIPGTAAGGRPPPHTNLQMRNKFVTGMLVSLQDRKRGVRLISKLDDDEYDGLLAHNIVFLKLVDCSAVNTVLECVARGTPIIVNRLAPLEELLGADYPGFYTTMDEADALASDWHTIMAAHRHIVNKVDTSQLCLARFVAGVEAALYDATTQTK